MWATRTSRQIARSPRFSLHVNQILETSPGETQENLSHMARLRCRFPFHFLPLPRHTSPP
jgi:hypothetical protein